MRKLKKAKKAKGLQPDSYHVPRGELVVQLRDSTDSLLVEKRQKITISATVSWQKLASELTVEQDGNLTVFIDNQDTEPVYFDNLELRVASDPTLVITQEHHYYPFGMNMTGIERDGELKYQFNGMIEREEAFGLELYETPFRSYDAQLGRFWQVEPLADIYVGVNMYQFAYNNPVSFNDPTGLNPNLGPVLSHMLDLFYQGKLDKGMSGDQFRESYNNRDIGRSNDPSEAQGYTEPAGQKLPVEVKVVNLDAEDCELAENAMKLAEETLNSVFGQGTFRFEFVNLGEVERDRKHYEAIIVIGQDGGDVKNYINEKLNSDFGYNMTPPRPETTTGWGKGTTFTGPYRHAEQIITFLNKQNGVGGPIVAISSNSIRNDFIGDEGNINTTAEQYLAYTMLHGLGHGAGIGNSHINSRWYNLNIPSIMMGGLGSLNTPVSISAIRNSSNFYNTATSFTNNIIYYQFMFNYYIMGQLWGEDRAYPAYNLGPFSRFPKNLLQYID